MNQEAKLITMTLYYCFQGIYQISKIHVMENDFAPPSLFLAFEENGGAKITTLARY